MNTSLEIKGHGYAGAVGYPPAGERGESLRELRQNVLGVLRILKARRWAFLIPFCFATSMAFIYSLKIPRVYTTSVLFERIDDPVLRGLSQGQAVGAFDYFRRILPREIKSPEAVVPIMDSLGMLADIPRMTDGSPTPDGQLMIEERVEQLASQITVEWWERSEHSDTVELRYRGENRRTMVDLVERMRETYIALARGKLRETLESTRAFYEGLATDQKARIDEIDRELTEFKMGNPGIDPTDPDTITYQLTVLRSRLEDLEREKIRLARDLELREAFAAESADSDLELAKSMLAVATPTESPAAARLRNQVFELESEIEELRLTKGMTDRHPRIVELTTRRDRAEAELQTLEEVEIQSSPSDSVGAEEAPNRRMEYELASLQDRIEENERAIGVTEDTLARYEQMQGNVFLNRKSYLERAEVLADERADYLKNKARVQELTRRLNVEEMDRGIQFATIQPAKFDPIAVSPSLKSVLLLSLFAGLLLGGGMVTALELFDRRIRNVEQINRYLGLPVLECVGVITTAAEHRRGFVRRTVLAPSAILMLAIMTMGSGYLAWSSLAKPQWFDATMSVLGMGPSTPWVSTRVSPARAAFQIDGVVTPDPSSSEEAGSIPVDREFVDRLIQELKGPGPRVASEAVDGGESSD